MPEVFDSIAGIRKQVRDWQAEGLRVGFVPTMGNLHSGHLKLVEAAAERADRIVASIFVNPTQFSAGEDFDKYPRTFESDCEKLEGSGCHVVFAPTTAVMYPHGQTDTTLVEVPDIAHILCGEFRPGHFVGVTTVVAKLFNMVPADIAVFGQKDFQQLMAIRRMVAELDFPVKVIGIPTVRESDGLAMSSRNQYMNADERQKAPAIFRAMKTVGEAVQSGRFDSERRRDELEAEGADTLRKAGLSPEYFSLRNGDNLHPAQPDDDHLVVLVAARLGAARLIDNLVIRES